MRYIKEILKNNKLWVLAYIGNIVINGWLYIDAGVRCKVVLYTCTRID